MKGLDLVRLWAVATAMGAWYGLNDLVFSWNPLAAAPYLAHRSEAVFRAVPAYLIGMLAEGMNGWIATFGFLLVERSLPGGLLRRGLSFGGLIFGFWVLSGTASAAVWLELPASLVVANVLFGLPKSLSLGLGLAWLWQRWPPRPA